MESENFAVKKNSKIPRSVAIWLSIGVVLVVVQIVLGGITRLTNSGLSITEWNVIGGVIPPLNEEQWMDAFEKYQTHAYTQFEQLHSDMTLSQFKFIYFWEYFHRLWARSIGFIFLFPFIYFAIKGYFNRAMWIRLLTLVGLGGLVAVFGWIMVASGLNTSELAWVNAYKLTIHLSLALLVLGYLLWITYGAWQPNPTDGHDKSTKSFVRLITFVAVVQLALGGVMSGMKAGLIYPSFPLMSSEPGIHTGGDFIPPVLFKPNEWNVDNFVNYQKNSFAPAFVQVAHRGTAYLLSLLIIMLLLSTNRKNLSRTFLTGRNLLLLITAIQITLGIFTLVNCVGSIPPLLGVLHQFFGVTLFSVLIFLNYQFSSNSENPLNTTVSDDLDIVSKPVENYDYNKGVNL